MAGKLKVTQIRSGIGRPSDQRLTLRGLGLTRMHKSVVLKDTEAIRGMIRKIQHLVVIEPATEG
jgi:large subunit ribosomal protein L30